MVVFSKSLSLGAGPVIRVAILQLLKRGKRNYLSKVDNLGETVDKWAVTVDKIAVWLISFLKRLINCQTWFNNRAY
jgi:hypothetical protein